MLGPKAATAADAPAPTGIAVYVFTFSRAAAGDRAGIETNLVDRINQERGPYIACDKVKAAPSCSVDDAGILVYGSVIDANTVQVNARENLQGAGGRWLGSITMTNGDSPGSLGQDQVTALLGGVAIVNGKLVPVPGGFQQFIQLVPQAVAATDPDYSGLLAFVLSQRGIVAFPSQATLGAVGSNPSGPDCSQGAEYLIYRLNVNPVPHPIVGYTRIGVTVTGTFVNCNESKNLATGFSGEARTNIPTTASSALVYSALLKAVFPALGWTSIGLGLGTISGFVDQKPDSLEVRGAVGEFALRNFVNNFCLTLPSATPAPSPSGSAGLSPRTFGQSGSGTATATFDPANAAIGTAPYKPACYKPALSGPSPNP